MTINEKGKETLVEIEERVIHFIQLERLVQANSTKIYGNMSYKYSSHEQVKANRDVFWSDLLHKISEIKGSRKILEPIILNPQMSREIMIVEKEMAGEGWLRLSSLRCDGLLFLKPTYYIIPLGLVAADCAPVSIYLPSSNTFMLVHVSRKNIAIIQDALEILYGIYLAAIYDTRNRVKLVASPNLNFEVFVIIGPAAKYPFNIDQTAQKEIFIDIQQEIIKQLEEFEKKVPIVSTVYCSTYHTTDSDSLFYFHHLSSKREELEQRFLSLTMII